MSVSHINVRVLILNANRAQNDANSRKLSPSGAVVFLFSRHYCSRQVNLISYLCAPIDTCRTGAIKHKPAKTLAHKMLQVRTYLTNSFLRCPSTIRRSVATVTSLRQSSNIAATDEVTCISSNIYSNTWLSCVCFPFYPSANDTKAYFPRAGTRQSHMPRFRGPVNSK